MINTAQSADSVVQRDQWAFFQLSPYTQLCKGILHGRYFSPAAPMRCVWIVWILIESTQIYKYLYLYMACQNHRENKKIKKSKDHVEINKKTQERTKKIENPTLSGTMKESLLLIVGIVLEIFFVCFLGLFPMGVLVFFQMIFGFVGFFGFCRCF